jgi:hypothetical protein
VQAEWDAKGGVIPINLGAIELDGDKNKIKSII